jgi:hypothetical protein
MFKLPRTALAAGLLALAASTGVGCATTKSKSKSAADAAATGKVRHVVLLQFKEGTTAEDIAKVERAFAALPGKIPQIRKFEWGTDMSPEGLAAGHTHCFLLTFDTPADRDAYLPHPAHAAFVDVLKPHLEKATVVDYVARKD